MEESKGFRVDVNFSDCKMPVDFDRSGLDLQASVKQNVHSVKFGGSASITISGFTAELPLNLSLSLKGEEIASASVPLGSLCGKTLTGDFDKLIKLEPLKGSSLETVKSIKVKITGSLRPFKKGTRGKSATLTLSPHKKSKCPYLKKLLTVEDYDREIQTTLLRVKQRLGPDYNDLFEQGVRAAAIRSPGRASPTRTAGRSPLRQAKRDASSALSEDLTYLELPSKFDLTLENLSSQEPQLLKNVAIALSEKIEVMKVQVEEYETIQEVLLTFEGPMHDLNESVKETRNQIQDEDRRIDEVINKVSEENLSLDEELKATKSRRVDIENEIQELRSLIEEVKLSNEKARTEENSHSGTVEELKAEIAANESEINSLHKSYEKALSEFSSHAEDMDLERNKILEEKAAALSELHELRVKLDETELEGIQLESSCAALKATLANQKDTQDRIKTLISMNEEYTKSNAVTSEQISKFSREVDSNSAQSSNLIKKLELDTKDLKNLQNAIESERAGKENQRKQFQNNLDEARGRLQEIQDMLANRSNIDQEIEDAYAEFVHENEVQEDIISEMTYLSDLVFSQAQTGLTTQRLYSRLVDMIDEKSYQKSSLRKMIDSMKKANPAYIPKKDDALDVALAKHLSKRDTTLDVNFVRIAPSSYTFGTKEINIHMEGNDLFVYLDKKAMPIEEFIEAYTEIEDERMAKKEEETKRNSPRRDTRSAKK